MEFKYDDKTSAPAPRGKIEENADLMKALRECPIGSSFVVKEKQIPAKTVRAHAGRVTRDATSGRKFVMRANKDKTELRVWPVAATAA